MKNKEILLLEKLQQLDIFKDLKMVADEYSRWDAESDKYIVEFKQRDTEYSDSMVELSKYEAMISEANGSNRTMVLVNYVEGVSIKLVNMRAHKYLSNIMAGATTEFNNGYKRKKSVIKYLDKDAYHIFRYNKEIDEYILTMIKGIDANKDERKLTIKCVR